VPVERAALLALSVLLFGFVPPRFQPRARTANVRVTDVGQTYSSINTIDCLGWPSDEIKKAAGSYSWGSWHPQNGDVGVAIAKSKHCFQTDVTVVIVRIGERYVPLGLKGISFESGSPDDVPQYTK
jgi:hypothetical protein